MFLAQNGQVFVKDLTPRCSGAEEVADDALTFFPTTARALCMLTHALSLVFSPHAGQIRFYEPPIKSVTFRHDVGHAGVHQSLRRRQNIQPGPARDEPATEGGRDA